jgi:hypothetical protein
MAHVRLSLPCFQDSLYPFLYHFLALSLVFPGVFYGVRSIERVSVVLVPTMLAFLVALLAYA